MSTQGEYKFEMLTDEQQIQMLDQRKLQYESQLYNIMMDMKAVAKSPSMSAINRARSVGELKNQRDDLISAIEMVDYEKSLFELVKPETQAETEDDTPQSIEWPEPTSQNLVGDQTE